MKYFVKVQLKKAQLAEIVYAKCHVDAETIARTNVAKLVNQWEDTITSVTVISFFDLGKAACICNTDISYYKGDYYYFGRKLNNDINFTMGFQEQYDAEAKYKEINETKT